VPGESRTMVAVDWPAKVKSNRAVLMPRCPFCRSRNVRHDIGPDGPRWRCADCQTRWRMIGDGDEAKTLYD